MHSPLSGTAATPKKHILKRLLLKYYQVMQLIKQLLEHQVMTPKQVAQKLTEDTYILFSDEEINKVSDEFEPDMETSVKEDIEM